MDKGLIMWIVFAAVFVVGLLVSRMIKNGTEKNPIPGRTSKRASGSASSTIQK